MFAYLKNYSELCSKWCYIKRPIISALVYKCSVLIRIINIYV